MLGAYLTPLSASAGEGFYLGLQAGANWVKDQNFKIYEAASVPILDLALLEDGSTISRIEYDVGYLGGLVFGYGLSNGLRFEIDLAQRESDADQQHDLNREPNEDNGDVRARSLMGNLWIDLGGRGPVRPYIGGGYGLVQIEVDDPSFRESPANKQDDDVGAWQAGAGLGFDLSPHWTLSIDYRYLNSEKGKFDFLDNNPDTYTKADYRSQSAMATLRYFFFAAEPEPAPVVAPPPPPPEVVAPVAPADSDGDGVADELDQCPGTPAGVKVNDVGCPLPACKTPEPGQPVTLEGCAAGDVIVLRGVNFEFDKSRLTANARGILDGVGDSLIKAPDIKVELGGHTDGKGTDEYNQRLSERRAESVRQYLVGKGVEPTRMTAVGYGESRPVADNETEEGRELNRRVELKVTEGSAVVASPVPASDASPAQ
jgi:OOP family OmpA-OmpF porin